MAEHLTVNETSLRHRHILLVEDEYFIADEMQRSLEAAGAIVIGPVASVEEALKLLNAETVDGAILDVKLDNENVFPLADALSTRHIPFLFATGYNARALPPAWRHIPRYEKPVDAEIIVRALLCDDAH